MVKAQQAGATIDKTAAQAMGEQLDNQKKMADMMQEQSQRTAMQFMSDAEIMRLANGG